jgi:hypothetical protein
MKLRNVRSSSRSTQPSNERRANPRRVPCRLLELVGGITPPVISGQPSSRMMTMGNMAVFTVGASGADPRTSQWMLNGVAIPGVNGSIFEKGNTQPAALGNYSVVISNALGGRRHDPDHFQ